MRKAAYGLAAVVATIVLLATLLPRVVSLEALRPRLAAALEARTGRKASLGPLSLSLFPRVAVRVRDLSLSGDAGHESERLLDVREAEVRPAILPLLGGRLEFKRIVLDRPAILVRKYPDGSSSLSGLSTRWAAAPAAPAGEAEGPRFVLDALEIRRASISLRSAGEGGRESVTDVGGVTARIDGIGGPRTGFDVSARIDGAVQGHVSAAGTLEREPGTAGAWRLVATGDLFRQDFTAEGRVVPVTGGPELDLAVAMQKIRVGDVPMLFRDWPAVLADAHPEGFASLAAKLSGTPDALGFEIDADLGRAGWTVRPGFQKFIDTPCTVVVQGHRFPDQLIVSNAELRFPPVLLIGNLAATPSTGAFEWSASSRIADLAEFARSRGELLQRWSPTGRLTASGSGRRAGRGSPAAWSVGVDLGEVGFGRKSPRAEFESLDGHLALTAEGVEFAPLAGLFNGQSFNLRGRLARGDRAAGPLDLKMAYLDLDALFPGGQHGRIEPRGAGAAKAKPESKAAAPDRLAFRANLAIDAGRFRGIDFRDLTGQVSFERGVHAFDRLRAKIYGGEATVTGRVDASGGRPGLDARIGLKDVDAAGLLSRWTRLGDFLSGPVTMDARIAGEIGDFEAFARTARGEGTIAVTNGRIRGIDLAGEAGRLSGLASLLPASAGKETRFASLSAPFRIAAGKIRSEALRIDGDRFGLDGSVALGFDRTIDFTGTLRLPSSASGRIRGQAGKFLAGPDGRIGIPLVVSGRLTAPAMAIDSVALAKGTARGAARRVLDLIGIGR